MYKENLFSFLRMKPNEDHQFSMILDPESKYHSINSRKVIYTKNLNLSKKVISMIVEDESFYLGHLLIIIETFSKSKISNISNMWEDLLETGIEYFKMGIDVFVGFISKRKTDFPCT